MRRRGGGGASASASASASAFSAANTASAGDRAPSSADQQGNQQSASAREISRESAAQARIFATYKTIIVEVVLFCYLCTTLFCQLFNMYRNALPKYANINIIIFTSLLLSRRLGNRLIFELRKRKPRDDKVYHHVLDALSYVAHAWVAAFAAAVWVPLDGRQRAITFLPAVGYAASYVYGLRTRVRVGTERTSQSSSSAPRAIWAPARAPLLLARTVLDAATATWLTCIIPIISQDNRLSVYFDPSHCLYLPLVCLVNSTCGLWLIETLDPNSEWKASSSFWGRWMLWDRATVAQKQSIRHPPKAWSRKHIPYTRPAVVSYSGNKLMLVSKSSYGEPIPSILVDLIHGAVADVPLHGVDNVVIVTLVVLLLLDLLLMLCSRTSCWLTHAISMLCTEIVLYALITFKVERLVKVYNKPTMQQLIAATS